MTVGLRKISEQAAGNRIELFGKQTDVVAARQQTIEQLPRLCITSLHNVVVDKPETAHQKSPFSGRQAISGIFGFVPQNEFVRDQSFFLDRTKSALHPRIGGGQKTDERDQQEAGIEPFRAVALHETVEIAVEAALTHFGVDFVGDRSPMLSRLR